jgi:hypothetical protein
MAFNHLLTALCCLILISACKTTRKMQPAHTEQVKENSLPSPEKKENGLIQEILFTGNSPFSMIFQHPDSFRLQMIYTQIDRDKDNKPHFTDHYYNLDPGRYFYPASTVKMPVAILALQKLRELNIPGLDRNSTMITEAAYNGQTTVYNDPATPDGRPNIASYIKKIFLVSDNDAYNRLYEFLGPEYINRELQKRGYTEAEIIHRLEISLSEDQNRHTNPIRFLDAAGNILYNQSARVNKNPYSQRNDKLGRGYLRNGIIQQGPLDFSGKNMISLLSLHNILRSVIFPENVPANQRFGLAEDDYSFLRQYMSATPSSVGFPPYDPKIYYDTYCKFLLFGAGIDEKIPAGLKVFNKVGDAYGHMLDIACFIDSVNKVEFMISAVIYCNKDGMLNDDKYDYEEIGYPFMKYAGQEIYNYEKERNRKLTAK